MDHEQQVGLDQFLDCGLDRCRVVGVAGSPAKCAYVIDELGFDACVNYRTDDLDAAFQETCPNGIDVYFENVGGAVYDAVTRNLAIGARIAVRRREGRSVKGLVGNWVFTGSPGTGKTTVARRVASVLHAYGLLATDHVEVTSALDLTGQYVGQTKKAVEERMAAARGGVLFIDDRGMWPE